MLTLDGMPARAASAGVGATISNLGSGCAGGEAMLGSRDLAAGDFERCLRREERSSGLRDMILTLGVIVNARTPSKGQRR